MADTEHAEIRLRDRLEAALASAETGDRAGVESATLRLILCAVDDRDVRARERGDCGGCPDAAMLDLLMTMAAQRRLSAGEYDKTGRIEEAERERAELNVIEAFLPEPLSGEALDGAVRDIVEELDARRLKDMGRCMLALKKRYPGQIETGSATKAMRAALS